MIIILYLNSAILCRPAWISPILNMFLFCLYGQLKFLLLFYFKLLPISHPSMMHQYLCPLPWLSSSHSFLSYCWLHLPPLASILLTLMWVFKGASSEHVVCAGYSQVCAEFQTLRLKWPIEPDSSTDTNLSQLIIAMWHIHMLIQTHSWQVDTVHEPSLN